MTIPVTIGAIGIITRGFKKFRSHTWKTFNRLTTEGGCTWNISHNAKSLKLEA